MDTRTLGKWAWLIALVVWVLVSALAALEINLGLPPIVTSLVALLAFLGGIFYIADMDDRNAFFLTAFFLWTFATITAASTMFNAELPQIGGLITGILTGAALAATAAAAGALLVVIYEWIMDATK